MEVQSLFTSPQLDSAELAALMRNKCLHGVFISPARRRARARARLNRPEMTEGEL